ncbi:MAG: hypothetical protein MZV70_04865 [Desulfobacterales bacterium]|nr:hypothetical protein [Desulfobacterales bacterium]
MAPPLLFFGDLFSWFFRWPSFPSRASAGLDRKPRLGSRFGRGQGGLAMDVEMRRYCSTVSRRGLRQPGGGRVRTQECGRIRWAEGDGRQSLLRRA